MPRHQKKAVLASLALTKWWANRENLFSTLSTADTATQTETAEKNHTESKPKQRAVWTSEQWQNCGFRRRYKSVAGQPTCQHRYE